ncbi:hypothetical protein T07_6149 [Trichinella nelsoni]|uniref:Uncharacterized protein n=1 Tax=Trichinella nelsoni TaxID=6336 RepID=A0A0V0RGJ2_9BILA|nr:hypothetical protein T07_6149 [Trichinella nelsoni]
MRTSMVNVRSSHWSATGRLDKWGHSLSFTGACRIFPQILGRTSACIGYRILGWDGSTAPRWNATRRIRRSVPPSLSTVTKRITSCGPCVGHILPNEGALGAWVEEAFYEHALTILAKGTRTHALEADLLSATVCGQHAAPRPGCLGCLVSGRRLRTVQKLVVTTPTSRHCALPPYFTSLRPMATLQTTETQLVPCCHA